MLWIRCIGLLFPPIGSLSLGDFNNFELDEDDAPAPPPLDERLLPPPLLPLFFEDRDEYKENTEEEGGVRGGLLEELCLLSGTKNTQNNSKTRHVNDHTMHCDNFLQIISYFDVLGVKTLLQRSLQDQLPLNIYNVLSCLLRFTHSDYTSPYCKGPLHQYYAIHLFL